MAQIVPRRSHDLQQPVSPLQTEFSSGFGRQASRPVDGEHRSVSPVSPLMSRRESIDSDRQSTASGLTSQFPSNPTYVNPAPAYVAPFGASQVVNDHLGSNNLRSSDTEDESDLQNKELQFSTSALALVNAFLDQLLYSFLSISRSTSLRALRPAVTEVLKQRLAREAIGNADVELRELLAGGDDEEDIDSKHKLQEEKRKWDLELVWKRTRLRVMVYMRLGEMEDDDEQVYVQSDELFYGSERRFTSSTGLVSWSAAIFLTSVLEYIAEQTLQSAGQAANNRARRQSRNHRRSMSSDLVGNRADYVVEDYDVEKVALHSTLGRLWRTWRKALRNNIASKTPTGASSPARSRSSRTNTTSAMGRQVELTGVPERSAADEFFTLTGDQIDSVSYTQYPEHVLAANIALPIADHTRDVDEIMVPGLAGDPDVEEIEHDPRQGPYSAHALALLVALPLNDIKRDVAEILIPGLARDPEPTDIPKTASTRSGPRRRSSLTEMSRQDIGRGVSGADESSSQGFGTQTQRRGFHRKRSSSSPTLPRTLLTERPLLKHGPSEKGVIEHDGQAIQGERIEIGQPDASSEWIKKDLEFKDVADLSKSEPTSMTAGTAAVASTGAAAATGWLAIARRGGATTNERQHEGSGDDSSSSENLAAAEPTRSEKEIEELDKRKSLLNMKSMLVSSSSSESSGQQSPVHPPAAVLPNEGTTSYCSIAITPPQPKATIQPADNEVENVPAMRSPDIASMQQPSNVAQRPVETAVDGSTMKPQDTSSEPTTAKQLSDSALENTSTIQPAQLASGIALPASRFETSAAPSANASRSRTDSETNRSLRAKTSLDTSNIQEHPVVQRLASRNGTTPVPSPGSEKAPPLTSAAIRGPEDFDTFVQGGETLKYTLTPGQVRDGPIDQQARYATSRDGPIDIDGTTVSPPLDSSSRAGRSPVVSTQTSKSDKRRSQSRPSTLNTNTHHKTGLYAREPRVMTESTRDFSDFIRSTGPDKDAPVRPLVTNASSASLHSLRSAHIQGASASRASSPGPDRSHIRRDDEDVPPVPPIPRKSRGALEARGAKVNDDDSSALIDFIRSGPKVDGERRISRTVAPFRTTMDSERSTEPAARHSAEKQPGHVPVASSSVTTVTRTTGPSRSTQVNGASAPPQVLQPITNGKPRGLQDNLSVGVATGRGNEPLRKQYRGKDPYAIDFDDDDDEDLIASAPRKTRNDESLLEFLRNHEPKSNGPPRPLIDPNSAQARRIIENARAGNPVAGPAKERSRSVPNNVRPSSSRPSTSPWGTALTGSGSRQAQINSTTAAPKTPKSSGSKSRSGTSALNTDELAYFARSPGPQDDSNSAPAPAVARNSKATQKEEEKQRKEIKKKKSSWFSRSKNTRYMDIP